MKKTLRRLFAFAIALATVIAATVSPVNEMTAKAAVVNEVITGGEGVITKTLTTGESATLTVDDCRLTVKVGLSTYKFMTIKSSGEPSAIVSYATIADDDLLHIIIHSGEYYVIDLRGADFSLMNVYRSQYTMKYCKESESGSYRSKGSVITNKLWFKEVTEDTDTPTPQRLVTRAEFESIVHPVQITYYTVTFKDYDGRVITTQTVQKGKAATPPANPSRTGYTFTGWSVDLSNIQSDVTAVAQYKQNVTKYTVTFKNYDGSVLSTQSVEKGKSATAPANPTRSGYTFTGWDKSFTNVQSNLTVTAQFKQNVVKYTVIFKNYDGSILSSQSVEKGKSATAPANPTRSGYTFTGWDKAFSNVQSDLTVTAQFKQNVVKYTVIFQNYDGSILSSQSVEKGKSATAPANPTRQGYTFTGWDKAYNNIQSDLTVTAQYKQNAAQVTKYTVVFKDYDGKVLSTQSVEKGKSATAPANPSRAGYTFTGWDKAYNNIQSDLVVTAKYSQNAPQVTKYTVTFKDFDGKVLSTQSVEKGKSATAPARPTRTGYTFTGWDRDFSNIQSDLVVIAVYTQDNSGNNGGNSGNDGNNNNNGSGSGSNSNSGSSSNTSASASASASAKVTVVTESTNNGWFVRNTFNKKTGYIKSVSLHKQGKGKVCTVKYNSKSKVAKFDGITYTNIKDVTFTQGSRQIIMLTKKGEVWIIPRAKGKIGKTWKKRVIKGKWKSISKDNQGFAIRIVKGSKNNPTVKGVVDAQPKQIKKSKK